MANEKLTDRPELLSPSDDDYIYIVDVSDTTDGTTGSSRKIKKSKFLESVSTTIVESSKFPLGTPNATIAVGGVAANTVLANKSSLELLEQMLVVYQNPVFAAINVAPQDTVVEVGTQLSGVKTFTWSASNVGNVKPNTISIYDTSASVQIIGSLANDGSESATIATRKLTSEGATQLWKVIGENTEDIAFESGNFTVTARYYRYYGPSVATPIDSAQVKLLGREFQQSGVNNFQLQTGSTRILFMVVLPPSKSITEVIDLDALNLNITSSYVFKGNISVLDADGVNASYRLYEMSIAVPYQTNHRHQIKTN